MLWFLVACPKPTIPVSEPAGCEAPPGAEAAAWFASVRQDSRFLAFAVAAFGPVATCTTTYDPGEYGVSATATFGFASGATFTFQNLPPETTIQELRSAGGLPDPDAAAAFLRAYAASAWPDVTIDWDRPVPEPADPTEDERVFWAPEEGLNLSFREIRDAGRLVAIRASWAL